MDAPLYTPRDTAPGPARSARPRRSGAEVYDRLRTELRSGRISGWDRLAEEPLAERFGVSRTPVREALTRLLSEGTLERRNGGIYLALPSFKELAGLYELRVTLELRGISRVMEDPSARHDRSVLVSALERWRGLERNDPAPSPQFVSEDELFHVALLDAAGDPALTAALVTVNVRIRSVRMYDYLTEDRISATIAEHTSILEHLLQAR
ncbi:GntR family transcriptional regulator, partial [Arthrobacter deserti]|nr:GntR family transcriptional regulator [Arthrobacter deserti]